MTFVMSCGSERVKQTFWKCIRSLYLCHPLRKIFFNVSQLDKSLHGQNSTLWKCLLGLFLGRKDRSIPAQLSRASYPYEMVPSSSGIQQEKLKMGQLHGEFPYNQQILQVFNLRVSNSSCLDVYGFLPLL